MRLIALLCTVFCLVVAMPTPLYAAAEPVITAKSAIVIEASTGKVLYEKNADERRYPASTTKVMTLITALEAGKMDDIVTTSANAAQTEGSSLSLTVGEQLSMLNMLYGMMMISGNDATVAVAEHISGSVGAFAHLMTEKAQKIGATHTHFTNTSGLPDPNHYTTVADMAKITAYGYRLPLFEDIVSTKVKQLPWQGKPYNRELFNENRMLWLYDGANGVKTGYTDAAGRCLISGAKRDGVQLIVVVFDSERMWDDSIALLNYAFLKVQAEPLLKQGDIVKTVKVEAGKEENAVALYASKDLFMAVSQGDQKEFKTQIDAPDTITAPVVKDQKIGEVRLLYKGKVIDSADLLAQDTVEKKSLFKTMWSSVWGVFMFLIRNFA
ncbi:MAG: D-alanyl-D-alanine carboxypeptidase family protein [Sporomusaceae bacterium]|nr:D-alanyl-D-alanine carboxypeptidase family protein [Sporomusaceae bacterium]